MINRLSRILAALAGSGSHDPLVARVCLATVEILGVDGAGLSILGDRDAVVCSSSASAERGEELQLTLGVGPCHEAFSTQLLVEEPDLANKGSYRWPGFAEELLDSGVGSVASFPLTVGTATIGALTIYHSATSTLSEAQVADGYVLAQVATYLILAAQASSTDEGLIQEMEEGFARFAPIHQATGMIMVQLGVGPVEAFVRLRSHAFAVNYPLLQAADDVIDRVLVFSPDEWEG